MFSYISQAFADGGLWMYAILAVHIVSLAIIAERIYSLYVKRGTSQKALANQFEDDIKRGELDHALRRAEALRGQPIGNIAASAIRSAMNLGGREEIHAKMEEHITTETESIERSTGFLAMLGNVGTLLGLLGTIVGLIQAFSSVATMTGTEKSIMLTQGVALAMNTTAYGLIMAIPALIMYAVLNNRSQRLIDDLNQGSTKIYNWLCFNFEPVQKPKKRSV